MPIFIDGQTDTDTNIRLRIQTDIDTDTYILVSANISVNISVLAQHFLQMIFIHIPAYWHHGQLLTVCNATPTAKSKMVTHGTQNSQGGLERGLSLGYLALLLAIKQNNVEREGLPPFQKDY